MQTVPGTFVRFHINYKLYRKQTQLHVLTFDELADFQFPLFCIQYVSVTREYKSYLKFGIVLNWGGGGGSTICESYPLKVLGLGGERRCY